MKTRIISLIFISLLGILHAGKAMSQEGIEEKLFKEAFPELQGNLLDSNKTSLSNEELLELRDLLKKIDNAIQNDLNAFKYGNLSADNALVFEYNKLKKAKKNLDIEKLEKLMMAEKRKIRAFIYGPPHNRRDDIKRNLALLIRASKYKKWEQAYNYWNELFHNYPSASKSIYSRGASILEYKFEQTKDLKWIDTLMMLYDQRIKYQFFGEKGEYPEGYILGRKAVDLLMHKKEAVDEAYEIFKRSVKLQGVKSEDAVLLSYMQATEGMFITKKIDAAEVVDNFTTITAILEERVKDSTNINAPKALEGVTYLFIKYDALNCDQMISAFQKQFNKNKTDVEQLEKIARMLSIKDCTDTELFSDVIAAIDSLRHTTRPSYDSLKWFIRRKDYDKAIIYLKKVIKHETEDSLNARNYYKLAYFSNEMGKKEQAKTHALKAISLKSNFGAPYILIATMYASSGCSVLTSPEGELKNVAYWAAVDKLVKAKTVDPSVSEAVNKLIYRYSGAYPNAEKAFLIGLTKGKTVKIGCWINEITTVRF